jgi:hypothetical protein
VRIGQGLELVPPGQRDRGDLVANIGVRRSSNLRARIATVALGGLVVVALTACNGGAKKSASTSPTTAPSQQSATTASSQQPVTAASSPTGSGSPTAGSANATFNPQGCAAPSADAIGSAFGAAITKTLPTADNGCLWQGGSLTQAVQVSYHTPADFNAVRISILKAGATPVTVPGATDAFVKRIALPNAINDVEYVIFDNGTVQIAFTGASGFLTDKNESAVTKAIVG